VVIGAVYPPRLESQVCVSKHAKLIAPLRESCKKVIYTSDGDFTLFVDDLAEAGVHDFVFEPWTDLEVIVQKYGQSHVIIGNVDTRILLTGTQEHIRADVERCINLGRDCPGFFLAMGNHIPPNTPVESALYYNEICEQLSQR
jgi:uroporphyrinogen-III decarboxylase